MFLIYILHGLESKKFTSGNEALVIFLNRPFLRLRGSIIKRTTLRRDIIDNRFKKQSETLSTAYGIQCFPKWRLFLGR